MVVSLDPKETYCGCGGRGHLEGIMGNRAMRLRFLDLEPERGLPRATPEGRTLRRVRNAVASRSRRRYGEQHTLDGPGKFFISGPNARFVHVNLLNQYLHEMVTMTPLQGSVFEVVSVNEEIAIVGAAVNASRAAGQLV